MTVDVVLATKAFLMGFEMLVHKSFWKNGSYPQNIISEDIFKQKHIKIYRNFALSKFSNLLLHIVTISY